MARGSSILYNFIFISIGLLYPAYCSIVALETKERADDTAWLMFWIVFALFSILEYFADFILSWFPLYPLFKIIDTTVLKAPILASARSGLTGLKPLPSYIYYKGLELPKLLWAKTYFQKP